jgi:Tol biopolymer transport system component
MRILLAAPCLVAVVAFAAPVSREWVQVSLDADGGDPSSFSVEPAVTPNGRYVAFHSAADDLRTAPANGDQEVYVRDMKTGVTELVSRTPEGNEGDSFSRYASLSANGRWVAFESDATDLAAGGGSGVDVFVADRQTGEVSLVSAGFDGSPPDDVSSAYGSVLSGNGRYLVFQSLATNLVEGVETNTYRQIYMKDLRTGTVTLVSRDRDDPLVGASGTCVDPSISPNGRFVVYSCNSANLVPGDSNGQSHVYVYDARRGTTARVSETAEGVLGSSGSFDPVISNNGRWVAFYTYAANLTFPHTMGASDAVLADRKTGAIVNMSASAGLMNSYSTAISASGKVVVFYSEKSSLVGGDGNGTGDVFRFHPATGDRTRLSVNAAGVEGDGYSYMYAPSLASNGRFLAIASDADNLADGPVDPDGDTDIFLIGL